MKLTQFHYNNRSCPGLVEANGLRSIDFDGDMVDFIRRGNPPDIRDDIISLDEVTWMVPCKYLPDKLMLYSL